jgi:hydrogenase maturation factor
LPDVCLPDEGGSCSVCADQGLIGQVLEVRRGAAQVRIGRGVQEVAVDLIDPVRPGDRVVVHLGFAIARVQDG